MSHTEPLEGATAVLKRKDLPSLLELLKEQGYRLVGPTIQDGAVSMGDIEGEGDLPIGWTAATGPGSYRLVPRGQPRVFAYPPEPRSAKAFLFPARRTLWSAVRNGASLRLEASATVGQPLALIGLHACDLRAIAIQDQVFLRPPFHDPAYQASRERAFLVGVNCGGAAATCFCASVGAGPKVADPHDLALTELFDGGHRFLVSVGSSRGAAVLERLPTTAPTGDDLAAAARATENAIRMQEKAIQTEGLKERLYANAEHHRWAEIAARCLSCGNCTSVCPTCFCHTVEDVSDLSGDRTERRRVWDSCFNEDFSYIHGGSVRTSVSSRYRQWLTHKLAAWQDQFDTIGCVGCGRCTTWCPAGIDLVEEANVIGGSEEPVAKASAQTEEPAPSLAASRG